jgi:hypothetical protein
MGRLSYVSGGQKQLTRGHQTWVHSDGSHDDQVGRLDHVSGDQKSLNGIT